LGKSAIQQEGKKLHAIKKKKPSTFFLAIGDGSLKIDIYKGMD
jgi:hypothetical protein